MTPAPTATLHALAGLRLPGYYRPLEGAFAAPVARLSGPQALLDEHRAQLPAGRARDEAVAVRLKRAGVTLVWGEPDAVTSTGVLLDACYQRGRSSVDLLRVDPSLLGGLQVGSWCDSGWRPRLARRAAARRNFCRAAGSALATVAANQAADLAFWAGVRDAASSREWRRLTASYVVLAYHRLAGEAKVGQEWLDVAPTRFSRQLRLLDRIGYRPMPLDELVRFHDDPGRALPRRGYVVTCDDGYRDNVAPLRREARRVPQLFVPTGAIGGRADWLDDEQLADEKQLTTLSRSGVGVGSHGRTHPSLPTLTGSALEDELAGSREDLKALLVPPLPPPLPAIAYPYGDHDNAVRAATIAAGYCAAFTAQSGRNGAGTDLFCLRRVGIGGPDGPLAFLWKVVTGEPLPPSLHRRQARRHGVAW